MIVLDLFCGAGGSALGIKQACQSAFIEGWDNKEQPSYPFEFKKGEWTEAITMRAIFETDMFWASPPCQAYSRGGNPRSRATYPRLIEPVREMLLRTGKPFVIENVAGAPLRKDLMLCGQMFNLGVYRHRIFEIHGFQCKQPEHPKHIGTVSDGDKIMVCRGGRPGCFGNKEKRAKLKAPTLEQASKAMGINHMKNFNEIAEAVPPAYSRYIFSEFLRAIAAARKTKVKP